MAKKGLGRGLGVLLGEEADKYSQRSSARREKSAKSAGDAEKRASENVSRETSGIRMSLIEPNPSQPRKKFDEDSLKELADSIKEHGLLQPILVKKRGRTYEIIAGERRWRAARLAGLKEIPAIVKDMDETEAAEAALIENIQREDLGSIEEARAYRALIEEYGLTQEELAKKLSKSRTAITNSLRLLQLDDEILDLIEEGKLTAGHARAVLSINGRRNQLKAAKEAASRGLSVRQTEKLAKTYNSAAKPKQDKAEPAVTQNEAPAEERRQQLKAVENELTDALNTKVSIKETEAGMGRIEIEYYSDEELNGLLDKLL